MNESASERGERRASALEAVRRLFGDQAESVLAKAAGLELADGEILFSQGDPGDCAYILLDGEMDVVVDLGFGPVRAAYLAREDLLGEIAVFCRSPRSATLAARGPVSLLRVEGADMLARMEASPHTARAIVEDLGRRLVRSNQPMVFFSAASHALRREDLSHEALRDMAARAGELGPFARTFLEMVAEIEAKHQRRQEMAMAMRIQQSVLPRPLGVDAASPVDLHAFMRPMREIGGDLYDYFPLDDRRLALAVGDVSGKGVPAALFMMMARTVLRSVAGVGLSVEECMNRLNQVLAEENEMCMFITLFFGVLDLDSGELQYCNAGHNPPCLLRADGGVERLPGTGPVAGVLEGARYTAASVGLESGDRLFLFTDGITEAASREFELFGDRRLIAELSGLLGATSAEMVAGVVAAVDRFAAEAEQCDDITCLALSLR